MKCYCIETKDKFTYYVENVEEKFIENLEHMLFVKVGDKYLKEIPSNINHKEIIKANFKKYGESIFKNKGNWEKSLEIFAKKCFEENIDWTIAGSICEAVRGINIIPHDMDIVIHAKDLDKIQALFLEYLIEPFVYHGNKWVLEYFGRICIEGVLIDIAADNDIKKDFYVFENFLWKNYYLKIKPIKIRYNIEIGRKRNERIKKIKEYMIKNGIK